MNLRKEKSIAILAAKEAGKILLKYAGKKKVGIEKSNKSLVSRADIEANKIIIKTIKKYFPGHSILSEETPFEDNKSDYKWVIDPLDGTHNFLHDIPLFGTSIALEYKNETIFGILHFPTLKLTAIAEKGKGAHINGKKINVSGRKKIEHAFIAFEYAYTNRKAKVSFLGRFVHTTIDLRNFGSAIYDLLLVACGKCDGFVILSTHEWDIAAGFLIVEEAGGKITDLRGKKCDLHGDKFVISNGKLHKKILAYLK